MAMVIDGQNIVFESVIYEDDAVRLRDAMQECAPEMIHFDFTSCDDVHLAVLQVIMAYKKLYSCDYRFGEEPMICQKVLEGFECIENHCN